YHPLGGKFADFDRDIYADPNFARAAVVEETDVLIIGGGFAGLLAGIRLREAGIKNLRIIEKGGDFGGTWYWNRYPGAASDVESYIYLPLLEETGYVPTEKYAKGPEIFEHSRRIARHYDLYESACLQTETTEMRWEESESMW